MSVQNEELDSIDESTPAESKKKTKKSKKTLSSTYDENVEFQLTRARILTRVLTEEDKKLVANLIDQTGQVILHMSDLQELIGVMKNVDPEEVLIATRETIVTECCKARILPFKTITGITVAGSKLSSTDKQILSSLYHISLTTVYDEPFTKLNKDEPEEANEEEE